MRAEEPRGQEINSSPEKLRQFGLKSDEAQSDGSFRLEFDEDVEVAIRREFAPERGAEHRKTVDPVTLAEVLQRPVIYQQTRHPIHPIIVALGLRGGPPYATFNQRHSSGIVGRLP